MDRASMTFRQKVEHSVSYHGLGKALGRGLKKGFGRIYRSFDIVVIIFRFDGWEPRLGRFRRGLEAFEVDPESFESHTDGLSPEKCEEIRAGFREGRRYFIGVKKGKTVAVLGASRSEKVRGYVHVAGDGEVMLHQLYVVPTSRKGPTGGVFAEMVFSLLKAEGIRCAYGLVHSENQASLVLSENLGWKQFERYRAHMLFDRFPFGHRRIAGEAERFAPARTARSRPRKRPAAPMPPGKEPSSDRPIASPPATPEGGSTDGAGAAQRSNSATTSS